MPHNEKLHYSTSSTYETLQDPQGWTHSARGSYHRVTGPCPRCGAEGQTGQIAKSGPVLPVTGDEEADLPMGLDESDDDFHVPVDCACGSTHAKDKSGCGAKFLVRIGDIR